MAFWVDDGVPPFGTTGQGPFYVGGKRRVSHSDGSDIDDGFSFMKRTRVVADDFENYEDFGRVSQGLNHHRCHGHGHPIQGHQSFDHRPQTHHHQYPMATSLKEDYNHSFGPLPVSGAIPKTPFLIIREGSPAQPSQLFGSCSMERTASGLSVSSDTTQNSITSLSSDPEDSLMLGDFQAARLVREHVAGFRRRCPDSQHGRILKALISPKSRAADFTMDNEALGSIFSAANELFFANQLTGRVAWDWSHPEHEQYEAHIVGTTALRRSRLGGYETLIVLSSPILKDTKYNRRLLISTFLHEMIHSYLFITCGLKARHCGGHTKGFRQIAETIDKWVGRDHLRLTDMEADLERFRDDLGRGEGQRVLHGGSPRHVWQGRVERDRVDYYPNEPSHHRLPTSHDEWQWYEREGFRARGVHPEGSPYVY